VAGIESVVIVGGGTAGWMTAASLAHRLGALGVKITAVESSAIGTVGVGEATVPAIRAYFDSLGLDTFELMKTSQATFKLGIEFAGWRHDGHRFFHSFGRYGVAHGPIAFHHLWQRLHDAGEPYPLDDYCLATQLAWQNRFAEANPHPRADFEAYDWAIHFDAGLFAACLRRFAEARGVVRIDARITDIRLNGESGDIASLLLDNGEMITGDLFIDCSGFRGLLIQGALKAGFVDWKHWLPCDRAIALPCMSPDAEITPYTRSTAQTAGWTWRIPLQHRVGNGYVYNSDHIDDSEAEAVLRAGLDGDALAEPNRLRFTAGHAKAFWQGNCVAIGLSGGFLEPLESTSITLIQLGIEKLLALWPARASDPALAAEYNRLTTIEFERIRDFIILHYALNQRHGDPLWDYCRHMAPPDSLQHKIDVFRAGGQFVRYDRESFFDPSWLCMYEGFGVMPQDGNPFAANIPLADLKTLAARLRADIRAMAEDAPTHEDVIRKYCQA